MTRHNIVPISPTMIGFDRLFRLLDAAAGWDEPASIYPPYDIEKADDESYRITLAVAGFGLDDLTVEQQENTLVVSGQQEAEKVEAKFLHRGIGAPSFQRSFQLADYVTVEGASLENGLLRIDLHREVPEALKPRRIEIGRGPGKLMGKARKLLQNATKAA